MAKPPTHVDEEPFKIDTNTRKINIYVNRARKSLIKILPPDINESSNKFYAGKNGIRCPLSIINGVGTSISNDIISERENGKFTDPIDFIVRNTEGMEYFEDLIKVLIKRLFLVLYMQEQLILDIIKILLYKI